jgi:hypothetical protein
VSHRPKHPKRSKRKEWTTKLCPSDSSDPKKIALVIEHNKRLLIEVPRNEVVILDGMARFEFFKKILKSTRLKARSKKSAKP